MSIVLVVILLGCCLTHTYASPWTLPSSICAASDTSAICRGGSTLSDIGSAVLQDVAASMASDEEDVALTFPCNIESAANDFSPSQGKLAWRFLRGLAASPTFVQQYWHKRPLVIRAKDAGGWVQDSFTVEKDLRLVGGSYISGHRTADVLRNGTKTDTWEFRPIKDNPARQTTWKEVEGALQGGTIYFNTAGSLWPTLGGLCRLTNAAFGIPSNVNVYVTPPGQTLSVPPHTDRQDVIVFQTAGAKRWRVFAPPPRQKGKDPLNRGKGGDVLTLEEMGEPLIDTVITKGDVLYVPTGFPHTTDTCTALDHDDNVFDETSVHLTMGLDTHVWGLTLAHLRWSLLQRCGSEFNLNIQDDEAYWAAMETIPIGFLGGEHWKQCLKKLSDGKGMDPTFRKDVVEHLKRVLILLEPSRWNGNEALPTDQEFGDVVDYMVQSHLLSLMAIQDEMFSNVDPHDEETLVKAFKCSQKQNGIMEQFGGFSKNEAMKSAFADQRMRVEEQTKGL